MVCEKLFKKIDELSDKYLDVLEDICKIESPTDDKEAVDRCGRYFIEFAKKKGWKYEVFDEAVSGDIVTVILNPDAEKAPVAMSAHLDTVHPAGLFKEPVVWRDDKNMYGPGVLDCKGGAAAGLLVLEALEEIGYSDRPVLLILQSDEEKGSTPSDKRTINHICERAKGSVAFLNAEGYSKDKLILTRKGILRYRIDVKGKAVHSAQSYNGKSAVLEASHKIIELEKIKEKEGVTYNCGVISGGTTPNTVAEECHFFVDIRYNTSAEYEEAVKRVAEIAERSYIGDTTARVSIVSMRPAMEYSEKNFALLDRINEIFSQNKIPTVTAHHGLGGSDAAYTTIAGIPTVDSIGPEGDRAHSVEESMVLSSFSECAKRMAAIAYCI
ncbi:MAG: M20/M25/M40 family metallo-hydrolase [Clostridia bacterium]|nr:M20/M25/M40 family metallo-hydrolase [Clostridia bacterium]